MSDFMRWFGRWALAILAAALLTVLFEFVLGHPGESGWRSLYFGVLAVLIAGELRGDR